MATTAQVQFRMCASRFSGVAGRASIVGGVAPIASTTLPASSALPSPTSSCHPSRAGAIDVT
jgi:hypothetical protein